jgi:hypothetical protein
MAMNSMAVAAWLCVTLFMATGVLTFLDTAGIYRIPNPSRSKTLFAILLAAVAAAGIIMFKHYFEHGTFPVAFGAQPTPVALLNIRAFPISQQQQLEFVHPQGRITVFCREVQVAQQKASFIVRGQWSGSSVIELPMHGTRIFSMDGTRYTVKLDGIVDWQDRSDQAFISLSNETT